MSECEGVYMQQYMQFGASTLVEHHSSGTYARFQDSKPSLLILPSKSGLCSAQTLP